MTFKGEVSEHRLKRVLRKYDAFIVKVVKLILGKKYVYGSERYRVD